MVSQTRRMVALAVMLGLPFAYSGCSTKQPAAPFVKMRTEFDYSEHEPFAKKGANGISGEGFVSQPESGVVTCAGSRVLLLPATPYFREMIGHIIAGSEPEPPETPYPTLKSMIRRTHCDAQGEFSFSEIPEGTFFVLTEVNVRGGGVLIGEVVVSGRMTQVLLTDRHLVKR
jgi:hypothetical protein